MRFKILSCIILLLPLCGFSQGEFNNWFFGSKAAITFNTSPPTNIPSTQMNSVTATASVSDSNGLVLFYSNGNYVFDRNHGIMSTLVWGMNSNQPVFAFKKIGENDRYWIFSLKDPLGNPPQPQGLFYSVIDMTLNGGLGAVISTQHNIPVPGAEFAYDRLTGTRHHNNRDAWLVTRDSTQHFLSYLISSAGISGPVISASSAGIPIFIRGGDLKISQDGKKLVANYASGFNYFWTQSGSEFCSFDSKTGSIIPLFYFKPVSSPLDTCTPHWAEFSPNSKLLYVGCHISIPPNIAKFGIFQYDATRNDSAGFMNSQVFLGYTDGPGGVRGLQMAPDGKIYSCFDGSDNLCVINYPNVPGTGCGFQIIGLNLNGKICYEGLPQFLQKYKAYVQCATTACQEDLVNFSSDIWPPADTIRWDFGDPASGNKNTSELANPGHTYVLPGTYTVQLYVRHNDARTDTTWKTLVINPKPSPALGADRVVCEGSGTTFDAGACAGCSYVWGNLTTGQPNIGTSQTYTTGQPGLYMVSVTSNLGCIGRDTVQLTTEPPPVSTTEPTNKTICSGEMTAISLTSVPVSTIYTWVPLLTSGNVTGFTADSGLAINQTLINNGATAGVVTYHITPKIGDCAATPVDYTVNVNVGLPVNVTISASGNPVCAGTPVNFTSNASNAGLNPTYQWVVNGVNVASATNSTYTYTPNNGDQVSVICNSSLVICVSNNPATSNAITMVVNPPQPVSVSISPSANPVCSGSPVTFTANPVNGGSNPGFQWKVNGLNAGTNSSVFTYNPVNGDQVSVICNSSLVICVSNNPAPSNTVTMAVNSNLPAGVTIAASNNPFCPGSLVTFTANPVNGGANPGFQWKVNGANAGTNSSVFTYNPVSGDQVFVICNSSLVICVSNNPATSNTVTMVGTLAPTVTFTPCFDSITTLNAKAFKLKGGLPFGGTYSGPGVDAMSGMLTPSAAGPGKKILSYSYTNVYSCPASAHCGLLIVNAPAFNCGNTFTDPRDGKSYPTVQIGTQCWMAANLEYGLTIDELTPQTDNCVAERYVRTSTFVPRTFASVLNSNFDCSAVRLFKNSDSLTPIRYSTFNIRYSTFNSPSFYQWDELMQYQTTESSQGLCPPGWHVPAESEWTTLFNFYQGASRAGQPLQDSLINGFHAKTSGVYYLNSRWSFTDFATIFWSSTPWSATKVISHGMNGIDFSVSLYPSARGNAFAVRCLRDN